MSVRDVVGECFEEGWRIFDMAMDWCDQKITLDNIARVLTAPVWIPLFLCIFLMGGTRMVWKRLFHKAKESA